MVKKNHSHDTNNWGEKNKLKIERALIKFAASNNQKFWPKLEIQMWMVR